MKRASKLEASSYDLIEQAMLVARPELPSALLATVKIGEPRRRCGIRDYDISLVRQLAELPGKPDVYVFTANSAIPVADAMLTYYQTLGLSVPKLLPITIFQRDVSKLDLITNTALQELRSDLAGATNVVLVEQHVETGATIKYASEMLLAAEVTDLWVIRGGWYSGAAEVDRAHMTSPHANFMHTIGRMAAEQCS